MLRTLAVILLVVALLIAAGLSYVRTTGLRADAVPGAAEARVARTVRAEEHT